MCGRYQLAITGQSLAGLLDAQLGVGVTLATWNAAPTQELPILALGRDGQRVLDVASWGLIPGWARRGDRPLRPMINARAESILEKPTFRGAVQRGRILVPITGFYEWSGAKGAKVPWSIRVCGAAVDPFSGERLDHEAGPEEPVEPFLLAGISEIWTSSDNVPERTFSIVTVPPNPLCERIHDRMPAILEGDDARLWLEAPADATDLVTELLQPFPADRMEAWAVGRDVNHAGNDGPSLARPA